MDQTVIMNKNDVCIFRGTGNTMLDIQLQDWYGNNRGGTYKYFALDDASKRYRLQVIHLVCTVLVWFCTIIGQTGAS